VEFKLLEYNEMLMRLINGLVSRKNRWGRHFLMKKKGAEAPEYPLQLF